MNYTFNNLVKQYENIDYEYSMNIKGKNATTFSDSYIYQNDIMNIKSKFFDICVSNDELRNAVADLNFDTYTTFNNIIDYKNVLYSKLCEFNSYILEVCENLEKASEEAYEEYYMNFKNNEKDYLFYKDQAYGAIVIYNSYNAKINDKETQINVEATSDERKEELRKEINEHKDMQKNILETFQNNISKMAEYYSKLKELLDEALKKMPPFVFV